MEPKKPEVKTLPNEEITHQKKEEIIVQENAPIIKEAVLQANIMPEKNIEKSVIPEEKPSVHPEKNTPFSFPLLLNTLKTTTAGLSTDLKMTRFKTENEALILTFSKKWNFDRVNTPKIKGTITETLYNLFG